MQDKKCNKKKPVSIWGDLFPAYASSPIYLNSDPMFQADKIDSTPKEESHVDAFPGYINHIH